MAWVELGRLGLLFHASSAHVAVTPFLGQLCLFLEVLLFERGIQDSRLVQQLLCLAGGTVRDVCCLISVSSSECWNDQPEVLLWHTLPFVISLMHQFPPAGVMQCVKKRRGEEETLETDEGQL